MNDDMRAKMQASIRPLNMNGLEGRMLRIEPSGKSSNEILVVYGLHTSIERMFGIAELLNEVGGVTMPDLPGFGGMDSFRKLGITPSLDAFADYLAAFIKLRYKKNQKIVVVGMSFGFAVVTRMLQKYPAMTKYVKTLVSFVGFTHRYDFKFTKKRYLGYRTLSAVFSHRIPAFLFYNIALHPSLIRLVYARTHNAKAKFEGLSKADKSAAKEFEVELWRNNDVQTYMRCVTASLTLDNCRVQVKLPVQHLAVDEDQYFVRDTVEQHMRVVFTDFTEHTAKMKNHAPSILATKEDARPFLPKSLEKEMRAL